VSEKGLREAFRSNAAEGSVGAAASLLKALLRAGQLTQEQVRLAAHLGREGARVLFPEEPQADFTNHDHVRLAVTHAHKFSSYGRNTFGFFARSCAEHAGIWPEDVSSAALYGEGALLDDENSAPYAKSASQCYAARAAASAATAIALMAPTDQTQWQRAWLAAYVLGEE